MITTDSFHIITLQADDSKSLSEMMVLNFDNFKRYFPITLSKNLSIEDSLSYIEEKRKENASKSEFTFGIKDVSNSKIIGLIIIKEINWDTKQGEFANCISTEYEKKGWMSKAIALTSKYGFEVLTLFRVNTGEKFWVDRGWVQAGETALTKPTIPTLPIGVVEIEGRVRLDSSLPRGAFFAISSGGEGIVSKLNAQSQLETEKYYIDLISGSLPQLTPAVPAQLPELSDGPHMAYALQWLFFGGLIVYGRILIRRSR
jgi:hypothetical protein